MTLQRAFELDRQLGSRECIAESERQIRERIARADCAIGLQRSGRAQLDAAVDQARLRQLRCALAQRDIGRPAQRQSRGVLDVDDEILQRARPTFIRLRALQIQVEGQRLTADTQRQVMRLRRAFRFGSHSVELQARRREFREIEADRTFRIARVGDVGLRLEGIHGEGF